MLYHFIHLKSLLWQTCCHYVINSDRNPLFSSCIVMTDWNGWKYRGCMVQDIVQPLTQTCLQETRIFIPASVFGAISNPADRKENKVPQGMYSDFVFFFFLVIIHLLFTSKQIFPFGGRFLMDKLWVESFFPNMKLQPDLKSHWTFKSLKKTHFAQLIWRWQ